MDTPQSRSSPVLGPDTPLDSAANEKHRLARKRRLTATTDLLPGNGPGQANKKTRLMQEHERDGVHIRDDVDDLIPRFRAMGQKSALFSPQSGGLDSAFIPFILDDAGGLSFYTPSPDSSEPDNTFSPPASSASNASFLGVLPDQPRQGRLDIPPTLQCLSIWRGGDTMPVHIYAQTVDQYPTRQTLSLSSLDQSVVRYDPVHSALAQLSCPFAHLDVSLAMPPSSTVDKPRTINSLVTISNPYRSPVRLVMAVYSGGALVTSYEAQMEEEGSLHPDGALYSATFPPEFIDEMCQEPSQDGGSNEASDGSSSKPGLLDCVAVMRFVQQRDEQEASDKSHDGETILVAVCDFRVVKGELPGEVHVSHLITGDLPSEKSHSPPVSLPTPPPSRERLADRAPSLFSNARRPGLSNRSMPKLSVAIPPPDMNPHGTKGCIQLYSATPDSTTRPTPQSGIPHNVLPVTPFEQLIHTPLNPPDIQRSSARNHYTPMPTESAYPFTLSSASPGTAPSPAFGVLDSEIGPGMSAPAWLTFPRNTTPFTPSFFLQQPHTAAASNAMSSLTQRALDAGTPTLPNLWRKSESFSQPLASPHPIASAPLFSVAQTDSNPLEPAAFPGWPIDPRSSQSS